MDYTGELIGGLAEERLRMLSRREVVQFFELARQLGVKARMIRFECPQLFLEVRC
jgi:hypothetical protein